MTGLTPNPISSHQACKPTAKNRGNKAVIKGWQIRQTISTSINCTNYKTGLKRQQQYTKEVNPE